jgi:NitT/TauT family transport system substrate-binding protein
MFPKKRNVAILAAALLAAIVIAVLAQQAPSMTGAFLPKQPQYEMTVAVATGPATGPIYVASEKGYFSEEGLNVTIVPLTSGRLALDALFAGKAQVATAAETPLALAAFQKHGFSIIATMTESPHKLVALKSKISAPADLKGKTVSTLKGSAGEFWMYSYLKANGLSASDVKFVNLQPTDAVAALIRGRSEERR